MENCLKNMRRGDGQYDAFMNALKKVYKQKKMELPVSDQTMQFAYRRVVRAMHCAKQSLPGVTTTKNLKQADSTATRLYRR